MPHEHSRIAQEEVCEPQENGTIVCVPKKKKRSWAAMSLTFCLMAVTWVILSGKFDAFHLALGLICCLLVSYTSSDLIFPNAKSARISIIWFRFMFYIPWLIIEIFKANIWVLKICLSPKMSNMIDPRIISFKSKLKGDLALVTFANSITLTPGTITVDVDWDNVFYVHAIDEKSAAGLPGAMEDKIAHVFGEDEGED